MFILYLVVAHAPVHVCPVPDLAPLHGLHYAALLRPQARPLPAHLLQHLHPLVTPVKTPACKN